MTKYLYTSYFEFFAEKPDVKKKNGNPYNWAECGMKSCSGSYRDGVGVSTTSQSFSDLDSNSIINAFKNLPLSFKINSSRENQVKYC